MNAQKKTTQAAIRPERELTDAVKTSIIQQTASYKKLWLELTPAEKRRALNESPDLWRFDELLRDIIENRDSDNDN